MKQTEITPFLGICILLLFVSACATVNPRPDYDRTAQLITQATGQTPVYHPDDEAVVKTTVEALLADGVTAQEAVQLCLVNNPKLQAAFFNVGVARADVVQSGLFSNPTLGFSLRFPDGGGPTSFEASLAQNIAELWQIPARKRTAERSLEQTLLELAREVSTTALAAKAAYLAQQASKQLEALVQELTQDTRVTYERARNAWENTRFYQQQLFPLRQGSLELSREAYRYGRASILQVLDAERRLLEARAGYLEALQMSSTALVDLERVTGQPAARILSVTQQQTPPFPCDSCRPHPLK